LKIALVTTPPSVRSGIGDYTRHLLPYLRESLEVELYVAPGREREPWPGETPRSALELDPRRVDRVLYQLGNEIHHAFMAPMVRQLGGVVVLHDWVLFDMALAAHPGLTRGGLKGHALALREGGLGQARVYANNWRDRRRHRLQPEPDPELQSLAGLLLSGWHGVEPQGRWTADRAWLRLPTRNAERLRFSYSSEPGRSLRVLEGRHELVRHECTPQAAGGELEARLRANGDAFVCIETEGIAVSEEQRRNGDTRRLGAFLRSLEWSDGARWHAIDLKLACARPPGSVSLNRDRFRLALNRSVVRCADAFLVHSQHVKRLVLEERGSATAAAVVHHGAEQRWRDEPRRPLRRALGLPDEWTDAFIVASFGGVQAHKRVDKLLAALALARKQRGDLRLVLAGSLSGGEFDPRALAANLGLAGAVHVTGYVEEERAWDWLHACDLAVNLRGPSTGGTSGGVFQALSMGRAVVVTDAAEQSELPDACCPKVPLEGEETQQLARCLVRLAGDADERARLERAAREFVERECHWGRVAREYASFLERAPRARTTRTGLARARASLARYGARSAAD
jgi:glycosyltransferase involved in cell wall biosynthesis